MEGWKIGLVILFFIILGTINQWGPVLEMLIRSIKGPRNSESSFD